jgi:hydroxyacyl-ACP dehydratase HTD2-like protein with hotdog domain
MDRKHCDDIAVGETIGPMNVTPSVVTLFRFSAVTWNAHRIHYDRTYALSEGYPDVLVQSHLHACHLSQLVSDWAGPLARFRRFGFRNRAFSSPGDVLTCTGSVTGIRIQDDLGYVECELEERNDRSDLCTVGWATVTLPLRG